MGVRKRPSVKKSGRVKIYNSDTGRGLIVEDADGQKPAESFAISFEQLADGYITLEAGEPVSFEVTAGNPRSPRTIQPLDH